MARGPRTRQAASVPRRPHQVGNALLGTTPALLAHGIPDEAFVAARRRREGVDGQAQGPQQGRTRSRRRTSSTFELRPEPSRRTGQSPRPPAKPTPAPSPRTTRAAARADAWRRLEADPTWWPPAASPTRGARRSSSPRPRRHRVRPGHHPRHPARTRPRTPTSVPDTHVTEVDDLPGSTGSSTGTWSSPTSSAFPTTAAPTPAPGGRAASPASSATRHGNGSSSRTRSSSARRPRRHRERGERRHPQGDDRRARRQRPRPATELPGARAAVRRHQPPAAQLRPLSRSPARATSTHTACSPRPCARSSAPTAPPGSSPRPA